MVFTFLAIVVMNILGTLRTVFLVKKRFMELHLTMFIDSMLFVFSMNQVISGGGLRWAVIYAVGRFTGVLIANMIDNWLAYGVEHYEISFSNEAKARKVRDVLGDHGYSVNLTFMEGYRGIARVKLEVQSPRKLSGKLNQLLLEEGLDDPTVVIHDLSKVGGKISRNLYHDVREL